MRTAAGAADFKPDTLYPAAAEAAQENGAESLSTQLIKSNVGLIEVNVSFKLSFTETPVDNIGVNPSS